MTFKPTHARALTDGDEALERPKWIPITEVMEVLAESKSETPDSWHWGANTRCKYLNIRLDMRDGHCLIYDRNNNPITLEQLRYQYSGTE